MSPRFGEVRQIEYATRKHIVLYLGSARHYISDEGTGGVSDYVVLTLWRQEPAGADMGGQYYPLGKTATCNPELDWDRGEALP